MIWLTNHVSDEKILVNPVHIVFCEPIQQTTNVILVSGKKFRVIESLARIEQLVQQAQLPMQVEVINQRIETR